MVVDMDILTAFAALILGLLLGALVGVLWTRSRPAVAQQAASLAADRAVVAEGLDRLHDQLRVLEHNRASWQGQFNEQVEDMRRSTESLRKETTSLSSALRKPQVRGRWGEMHLRRAVELAGLVDQCDFSEQVQLDDGALRPDLVVRLAGGKSLVVDSKVPLDAFLDATSADDEALREHHLDRHARQLRTHVDQLSSKAYWRSLEDSPEFVVLFVPAEAFLYAALDAQTNLIDYAAERRVILATPTTLIALLRTVAHGWSHERLADQAHEVQRLGRELHERLGLMGSHLDKVGRSLGAAVSSYNQAVGSLEARVLVTARRFTDLGVTDQALPSPRPVEQLPRGLSAPELAALEFEALGDAASPLTARRSKGA